jgi:hypothetical protein
MYPITESYALSEQDSALYVTEARRIYRALFGRPIPPIITARFAAASEQLEAAVDPQELAAYRRFIAACPDLEAGEVAGRYTRRLKLLSRKFRLMVYLAETLPENQPFFVNERTNFLAGLWHCCAGAARTAFKLAKGVWLLRGETPKV